MKNLQQIIAFLLQHSIMAACSAVALCIATESLLCRHLSDTSFHLHAFLFGSILLAYNIHFAWVDKISKSAKVLSVARIILLLLGAALAIYGLSQMTSSNYVWMIALGICSVLYSLPLLPLGKRIKDFGVLKLLTLTATWTIATTILPLHNLGASPWNYPLELGLRFTFMFSLCAAFDIRDLAIDTALGIKTIPKLLGIRRTQQLIHVALIIFFILSCIQYWRLHDFGRWMVELMVAICTFFAIKYAFVMKSNYHYLLYVDGMMLLYGTLMALQMLL